ncbi:MAG: hypothetical protein D3906_01570 [Candidatus Electrothrix sp. AUS1_2]|nr:hypothetical protein [Candidatus Electrothrix sp. AUS1_2]
MQSEQILIQKIASRPSTEELILFIAENDAITQTCSELRKALTRNDKKKLKEINMLCQRYHISVGYLTRELNHIQSIFAPRQITSDDHKMLGLQPGASIAEIKQAYRRLSLQHHPDISSKNDSAYFIEITKAYRRLLDKVNTEERSSVAPSAWRYRKKAPSPQQREKKYIYVISLLIGGVLLAILTLSFYYQNRAMLNNLSKASSASVQKQPEKKTEAAPEKKRSVPPSEPSMQVAHSQFIAKKTVSSEKPQEPISLSQKSSKITLIPSSAESLEQSPLPQVGVEDEEHADMSSDFSEKFDVSSEQSSVHPNLTVAPVDSPENVEAGEEQAPFSDIYEESPKEEREAAPARAADISKKEETHSIFTEKQYQEAVVVKPTEKKIKKSIAATEGKQFPQEQIRDFLGIYTATYLSKDIKKFSQLFTRDAQENGIRFSKMRKKYIRLFRAVRSIDYHIDVLGIDIQDEGRSATVTGRFRMQLIYTPEKMKNNTGTLTLFLIKDSGSFKVKGLSYNLDPEW